MASTQSGSPKHGQIPRCSLRQFSDLGRESTVVENRFLELSPTSGQVFIGSTGKLQKGNDGDTSRRRLPLPLHLPNDERIDLDALHLLDDEGPTRQPKVFCL
ncbi:hypothetical protein AMTR_s00025p00111700 [Amborella trichopoda]|uniref:Uncharacterized protein n=1 Tax=Amborella trichopoda TaxID=13333 RepID=W1PWV0_AMBTC|nr:hypothetical protein AMTR_s00025p00111700 [Amborella trichopoda]